MDIQKLDAKTPIAVGCKSHTRYFGNLELGCFFFHLMLSYDQNIWLFKIFT